MSHSISTMLRMPFPNHVSSSTPKLLQPMIKIRTRTRTRTHSECFNTKCELNEESTSTRRNSASKLSIGSPIIITEAPKMVKTAASVPCLRVNDGLVNPGDVGRIVSRKPMDVWAVRLSIGTYLIDRKYFKPLELDE